MVAPQDQIAQQTSQAELGTNQNFRGIRRDRHKRDASTRQAQHRHQQLVKACRYARAGKRSMGINNWQNHKPIPNRYARAGAAATSYKQTLRQHAKVINAERIVVVTCHIPSITRCIRKRNSGRETSRRDLTAKVFANIRQRNIGSSLLTWAE